MAVQSPDDFFELLSKSDLLSADQLEAARSSTSEATDASTVARQLARQGVLTRWQAGQLLAGRTTFHLGKYRLIDLLGRGGMGSVFLGEHVMMNRRVALKIVSRDVGSDPVRLERFLDEARAIAALDHPAIVQAYSVDNEGDRYYIVMEYVEGRDLQRVVDEDGTLDWTTAAAYIRQAADGLAHAHERQLIHCDIKPSNLLLGPQGRVKILDMGLARLGKDEEEEGEDLTESRENQILGSVDYLAPEQALESEEFDYRADIYALGCTFYFLLTGHPPFPEGTLHQRILKHQTQDPSPIESERPDVPGPLADICRRMMAKEPGERYQDAGEVAHALGELLAENEGGAGAMGFPAIDVGSSGGAPTTAPPEESLQAAEGLSTKVLAGIVGGGVLLLVMVALGTALVVASLSGSDKPDAETEVAAGPDAPNDENSNESVGSTADRGDSDPSDASPDGGPEEGPEDDVWPNDFGTSDPGDGASGETDGDQRATDGAETTPDTANGSSAGGGEAQADGGREPGPTDHAANGGASNDTAGETNPTGQPPDGTPGEEPASEPPNNTGPSGTESEPEQGNPEPVDPFENLPAHVAWPESGGPSGVTVLGEVRLADGATWDMTLHGGETAVKGARSVVLEPDAASSVRTWLISLRESAGDDASSTDVARIGIPPASNKLVIQWLAGAASRDADALLNTALRLVSGESTRWISFGTPRSAEPLEVDWKRPALSDAIVLKSPPKEESLRFRAEGLVGTELKPSYSPEGKNTVAVDETLRVDLVSGKAQVELHIKPEMRGRTLNLRVQPKYRLEGFQESEPLLLGKLALANRQLIAQRQQIETFVKRTKNDQMKKQAEQQRKNIDSLLEGMQQLRELLAPMSEGVAIQYRVFTLADGHEIDLVVSQSQLSSGE